MAIVHKRVTGTGFVNPTHLAQRGTGGVLESADGAGCTVGHRGTRVVGTELATRTSSATPCRRRQAAIAIVEALVAITVGLLVAAGGTVKGFRADIALSRLRHVGPAPLWAQRAL